jgi:hypothetical protein
MLMGVHFTLVEAARARTDDRAAGAVAPEGQHPFGNGMPLRAGHPFGTERERRGLAYGHGRLMARLSGDDKRPIGRSGGVAADRISRDDPPPGSPPESAGPSGRRKLRRGPAS